MELIMRTLPISHQSLPIGANLHGFLVASSNSGSNRPANAHFRRTELSGCVTNGNQVSSCASRPVGCGLRAAQEWRSHFRRAEQSEGGFSSQVALLAPCRHSSCYRTNAAAREEVSVGNGEGQEAEQDENRWDVSSNCVNPVFRMSPLASEDSNGIDGGCVNILFLSEGNVCRSIYAESIFTSLLKRHNLQGLVNCSSKATRDYNVGETIDPRALSVAEEHELELLEGKVATVFNCAIDIVKSDMLLVMDKFTASDTLKEITVYEIVNKNGWYSGKVRRLGEFCRPQQIEDIEDPLYGNMGGTEEIEFLHEVYAQVRDSCEGLIEYLLEIQANLQESESFKDGLARTLGRMDKLNWLAPPMLSKV